MSEQQNPLFGGNVNGAKIWFKLLESNDPRDVEIVQRTNDNAQKTGKFYFSDFIEQRKKALNNQSWYMANWNPERNQWVIDLLLAIG